MMMYWSHFKILLPVVLKEITLLNTDNASRTKMPPIIDKMISLVATVIAPIAPPIDKDPVSPIETIAGGALYHKNPIQSQLKQRKLLPIHQYHLRMEF